MGGRSGSEGESEIFPALLVSGQTKEREGERGGRRSGAGVVRATIQKYTWFEVCGFREGRRARLYSGTKPFLQTDAGELIRDGEGQIGTVEVK